MELDNYYFELHYGRLCKDKLREKPNNNVLATIYEQVKHSQCEKIESYYCVLDNEYGGDTWFDVLLLIKMDDAPGFKPIVVKNTVPGCINQCMEYDNYMGETVEYTILDCVMWSTPELLIRVNDTYKNGLYQFLAKKYILVKDEIVLFE